MGINTAADAGQQVSTLEPVPGGSIFRIGVIPPEDPNVPLAERERQMAKMFEQMNAIESAPDLSFQEFLNRVDSPPEVKQQALQFVEGFHAADPSRISVHSLIKSNIAEEQIEGDRQFRFERGYQPLVELIANGLSSHVQLRAEVNKITWKTKDVQVQTAGGQMYQAHRALITVPLGVLKAGVIQFEPLEEVTAQEFHR